MRRILPVLCALAAFWLMTCGDYPIFTEMSGNRLKVVLKGTFESNDPDGWDSGFPMDIDSVDDHPFGLDEDPTRFMLDIAEMRLRGSGDADRFAFYRQTFSFEIDDLNDFFNGEGVEFDCDDPYSDKRYDRVLIYIRKMIFNNAQRYRYTGSGWERDDDDPEVIFREVVTEGFDFNQLQYNTYWDTLRVEAGNLLRIFPLVVYFPPGGFVYDRNDGETVLEIRFVIKNFIKQYEYDYISGGVGHLIHYWGPSDWLRDVKADERVIGGNLLAVARTYVTGKTATISGPATSGRYVIAIEKDVDDISNYTITDRSRPVNCDPPKAPNILNLDSMSNMLDYYIEFELYKKDINDFIDVCLDDDTYLYETDWDEYQDRMRDFKIPPIVTISDGSYTLSNVPVGKTYLVYESTTDAVKAVLPDDYSLLGEVIIPANGAGQGFSP